MDDVDHRIDARVDVDEEEADGGVDVSEMHGGEAEVRHQVVELVPHPAEGEADADNGERLQDVPACARIPTRFLVSSGSVRVGGVGRLNLYTGDLVGAFEHGEHPVVAERHDDQWQEKLHND